MVIPLLASADRAAELARCRQAGLTLMLSKPLKRSDLLRALLAAEGEPPPSLGDSVQVDSVLVTGPAGLPPSAMVSDERCIEQSSPGSERTANITEVH